MPREIIAREYLSPDGAQGGLQSLDRREGSLQGQIALVTGSSRDLGAGIAIALARSGASVLGNHRDPQKEKRAIAVEREIKSLGGDIYFVTADITNPDDRESLYTAFWVKYGREALLDMLVLNASGPTIDVNVTAANALVDMFLPVMKAGSRIALMQSVPGHLYDQIDPESIPEFYRDVARAKFEGEKSLRTRIDEFDNKGVKFFVVCPLAIMDTSNMRFFQRLDPLAASKHKAISESLGLPHEITIGKVADKVTSLLTSPPSQGSIELFKDLPRQ